MLKRKASGDALRGTGDPAGARSPAVRRIVGVTPDHTCIWGPSAPRPGPPRTRSPSRPRPNNPGAGPLGVDPEGPRLLPPPWGLGYELPSLCGLARTVQRVTRQRRGWRDQACAGARRTAFCMVPIRPCRSGDPPKQGLSNSILRLPTSRSKCTHSCPDSVHFPPDGPHWGTFWPILTPDLPGLVPFWPHMTRGGQPPPHLGEIFPFPSGRCCGLCCAVPARVPASVV